MILHLLLTNGIFIRKIKTRTGYDVILHLLVTNGIFVRRIMTRTNSGVIIAINHVTLEYVLETP